MNIFIFQLRNEWGYKYWVTCDAGSIDLQITTHFTCGTRECAAKTALESGLSGEMGGGECFTFSCKPKPTVMPGTYTYETLTQQVKDGQVDEKFVDETVKFLLRTKFSLGLFESECNDREKSHSLMCCRPLPIRRLPVYFTYTCVASRSSTRRS